MSTNVKGNKYYGLSNTIRNKKKVREANIKIGELYRILLILSLMNYFIGIILLFRSRYSLEVNIALSAIVIALSSLLFIHAVTMFIVKLYRSHYDRCSKRDSMDNVEYFKNCKFAYINKDKVDDSKYYDDKYSSLISNGKIIDQVKRNRSSFGEYVRESEISSGLTVIKSLCILSVIIINTYEAYSKGYNKFLLPLVASLLILGFICSVVKYSMFLMKFYKYCKSSDSIYKRRAKPIIYTVAVIQFVSLAAFACFSTFMFVDLIGKCSNSHIAIPHSLIIKLVFSTTLMVFFLVTTCFVWPRVQNTVIKYWDNELNIVEEIDSLVSKGDIKSQEKALNNLKTLICKEDALSEHTAIEVSIVLDEYIHRFNLDSNDKGELSANLVLQAKEELIKHDYYIESDCSCSK